MIPLTENWLISCFYCKNLFITAILRGNWVTCPQCRKGIELNNNPRYYKRLDNTMSDKQIRAFNKLQLRDKLIRLKLIWIEQP